MPGRMIPSVSASIHPGGGAAPPGMSPMSGNLIGPRVPLAAPNGMCECTEGVVLGGSSLAGKGILVGTPYFLRE